jgi:hypothetical protein
LTLRDRAINIGLGGSSPMRTRLFFATALSLAFSSLAFAGARVSVKSGAAADQADYRRLHDHPLAQAAVNPDVRIQITGDHVMRSCCKPPDLVVSGKVTNITPRPIDYVRLLIAMKDAKGRVVYTDSTYNHGAVTLFEDPEIAKILSEKPHSDPIGPGASDTFVFMISLPSVPSYKSTMVLATDVVRDHTIAESR